MKREWDYLLDPEEEEERLNAWASEKDVRAELYYNYTCSPQWEEIKEKALKRDRFQCVECGEINGLQVHHVRYSRWGNERIENLVTLCPKCHAERHFPST